MSRVRAFARRHAVVLGIVVVAAWIVAITWMIMANPVPGGGSPV
ncbi:hypothetical protein [Longispora fulva]|uniref:Uncharacterized protein n=1 Tax=Longispora fulva TaxID=619741 RepID=A0A8J7G8G9_9ACTN|nr:hypothetical protein [Longispora fulva]MBG6134890.1 hypothetical protein [Longispora fulva]